jgi:hypothetical protein
VRKPVSFAENNLEHFKLFSIVTLRRCENINGIDILILRAKMNIRSFLIRALPTRVKAVIRKLIFRD